MRSDPELFAALGGRPAIELIVDGLYDRLERDPELTRLFRSRRNGERVGKLIAGDRVDYLLRAHSSSLFL